MPAIETIQFTADGFQLVGTLHRPNTPNPPVVIGCHGLLANRQSPKQIALAEACNRQGLAYFRFDHRGCGDSQGEFSKNTTLAARRQDLYHAVQTMQAYSGVGLLAGVFGSSFGGTVALSYAANYPSPAVVTYAAPLSSATIRHAAIRDNHGRIPAPSLFNESLSFDLEFSLDRVSHVLIIHSEGDETVPIDHAHQIYKKVISPKKLIIFEGGDHRMSNARHQERLKRCMTDWILHHLRRQWP